MTGRRLPPSWTRRLRQSSVPSHQNTYSLLDAAALATTTQLDFSDPDSAPDFTAISFYKIFSFPHLGALIVRKESGHILGWRKYFGGGTVNSLTVLHEPSVQKKDATLHDALEDGTLPFHNIIALGCAIGVHLRLYGSMKTTLLSYHGAST
jgi:molybdenum cofactor sulfurtransferase